MNDCLCGTCHLCQLCLSEDGEEAPAVAEDGRFGPVCQACYQAIAQADAVSPPGQPWCRGVNE